MVSTGPFSEPLSPILSFGARAGPAEGCQLAHFAGLYLLSRRGRAGIRDKPSGNAPPVTHRLWARRRPRRVDDRCSCRARLVKRGEHPTQEGDTEMPIIVSSPGQFATRNYLALPLGGSRFLISLSGVAVIDLTGQGPNWRRDVAEIYVDLGDVLTATGQTPKQGYHLEFALQQWTSLATPNAF